MNNYSYSLKFRAEELEPIEALKGQQCFSLALAFNPKLVCRISGEDISPASASQLPDEHRLRVVEALCRHLSTSCETAPPQNHTCQQSLRPANL
jgi:hypothetical protein